MTAPAAAAVDCPRAVVGYHQGINRNIQPGGKAVQRVEMDFVGGAQGFQFRRVDASGLLHGGKRGILLTKQAGKGERVNAQAAFLSAGFTFLHGVSFLSVCDGCSSRKFAHDSIRLLGARARACARKVPPGCPAWVWVRCPVSVPGRVQQRPTWAGGLAAGLIAGVRRSDLAGAGHCKDFRVVV